jgi:hypothetical protein
MLQTFDKKTPLWEQRIRVAEAKNPGWKHGTRRRPSSRKAQQKAVTRKLAKDARARRYKAKVRAYWTGQSDKHP